mgnify:CR=1 FL=1
MKTEMVTVTIDEVDSALDFIEKIKYEEPDLASTLKRGMLELLAWRATHETTEMVLYETKEIH